MKKTEPKSHIIFPNHFVVTVEANEVDTVARLTREALRQHDALREADNESG